MLPDFHHKSDMEMPSSITVATVDTVRPLFTSASVNCGMALIALDVDRLRHADQEDVVGLPAGVRRRARDPLAHPLEIVPDVQHARF